MYQVKSLIADIYLNLNVSSESLINKA